jgi:GT2 family glycosyltransferase
MEDNEVKDRVKKTNISIIVLAQHESLSQSCLSSIILSTDGDYDLVVVNDGDHPKLRNWMLHDSKTKLLANPQRIGVSAGFNLGATHADANADLLVFVRDHVVVTEGWLERLRNCMDAHADAAIVGPISYGVSGPQRLELPGSNPHAAIGWANLHIGQSRIVPKLLSHLFMMRKDVFERIGLFDEQFGMEGYEDDDLCYRALSEGYSLYVAEDCFVHYTAPPSLFPERPDWYAEQLRTNRALFATKWGAGAQDDLHNWGRPVTVSLCMIVKNEEATLRS